MAGQTAQRRADRRHLPRAPRATSTAGWLPGLRIERGRPQRHIGAVAQGHRHLPGCAIDLDMAEELHAGRWRQVLLVRSRRLDEVQDLGDFELAANNARFSHNSWSGPMK